MTETEIRREIHRLNQELDELNKKKKAEKLNRLNEEYAGKWVQILDHKAIHIVHIKEFYYSEPHMYAICYKEIFINMTGNSLLYNNFENVNVYDAVTSKLKILDITEVRKLINEQLENTIKQYNKKFKNI